jgi:putative spermidine/putrescine transport system permease protein
MFERRTEALALVAPAALFSVFVFVAPVVILLSEGYRVQAHWSLAPVDAFFASSLNQAVFWRTLKIGVAVTAAAAALGYLAAQAIVDLPSRGKGRMVALVVLPLMISPVARTYAWIVILGRTGVVNRALLLIGVTDQPLRILFSETAIFIGLLQLLLPLMILSLIGALENLPRDAVAAARVLGANDLQIFAKIILPLTREGFAVGGTLVFAGSMTAYITPAVLGGAKVLMLETLLYQRVSVANDLASAGIIASLLIVMSFAANLVIRRIAKARSAS